MFFTQINQIMAQRVDLTLVIHKSNGQLTVSVLPKANGLKDTAQDHIVPLVVTGTPEELDYGFFMSITQPVQKASGLLSNMQQFEEQAGKTAANSRIAKEQKDKEAKEAKEKKEKYDKLMKKAEELMTARNYKEAIPVLEQAKQNAIPKNVKTVDEKILAAKSELRQGTLFDLDEMTPQTVPGQNKFNQSKQENQVVTQSPAPRQQTTPVPAQQQPAVRPPQQPMTGQPAAQRAQQPYMQPSRQPVGPQQNMQQTAPRQMPQQGVPLYAQNQMQAPQMPQQMPPQQYAPQDGYSQVMPPQTEPSASYGNNMPQDYGPEQYASRQIPPQEAALWDLPPYPAPDYEPINPEICQENPVNPMYDNTNRSF